MFSETVILVLERGSEENSSLANMIGERYRVIAVEKPDEALSYATDGVHLVIAELGAGDASGLHLLRSWKSHDNRTPFLFVTDGSDVASIVEAMKLGAADCLVCPVSPSALHSAIQQALNSRSKDTSANDEENRPTIDIPPGTSLEELERAAVEQALLEHHGNRTHAARTLGISVRTLQRKLKAWGIPVLSFQNASASNNFLYMEHHQPGSAHTPFSSHAH